MSNKQQLTQICIPFATSDYRLQGKALLGTDEFFIYKNIKGISVNYKGADLNRYLTYKRKEIDLAEHGSIFVYLHAMYPLEMVRSEFTQMLEKKQFRDINHLIDTFNNSEILS